MLDRLNVPATWFTPGHTVESFPEITGEIHDRGHDIQCHGWKHTDPSSFSEEEEREDIGRAVDAIQDITGGTPDGYRSPAWDFSTNTLSIIRDIGFEWDSSQMAHDFEPYLVRESPAVDPDEPYERGEETDIVEFPVSWHLDDWPPFQFVLNVPDNGGAPDEKQIFDMWTEKFDWMYDNVEGGVFTLTMHPQVIGVPPRMRYLEDMVQYIQSKQGVEFKTVSSVAAEY